MKIFGLALDEKGQAPIIILEDEASERGLPIWIGAMEAMSISMALNKVPFPRPMTHDLLINSLEALGGKLESIEVTRMVEGTFFAELIVKRADEVIRIDCRPSDAVALAVRTEAEISAAPEVLDEAGIPMDGLRDKVVPSTEASSWQDLLENLDEDDVKYKM
jgi:hypothetical protein